MGLFSSGSPEQTGKLGEAYTREILADRELNAKYYLRVFSNLYLTRNGKVSEIDLLALTEKGIFVFESKNYSGWIFGDLNSPKWTQVLKGGEKHQFYNPALQNAYHIKKLAAYLGIPAYRFYSYVVFSDRCTFKKVPENLEYLKVIHRDALLYWMRWELSRRETVFSREELDELYAKLYPLTRKTQAEKDIQLEQVRSIQTNRICPLCRKPLILKHGKYGDFYGCSGFPSCRYTDRIKQ